MPTRIHDASLRSLYSSLEKSAGTINDSNILSLLSRVADGSRMSGAKALTELSRPGITRQEQVNLIKAGLTPNEKKDLIAILDQGQVAMEPSARQFLSAVVDRVSQPVTGNALQITGDQRNGLQGLMTPGATIEAINLSTAPSGRLHMDDTMVIGKADASGKFLGRLPDMEQGDLIRVRARTADGKVTDWVTLNASGLAQTDTRNAQVSLLRIGMTAGSNGKIDVTNINASRQISEPGAKMQFTNTRTGEKTVTTITDIGGFPAGFQVNGKAGDTFSIAVSDGKNNTNFAQEVGKATVPGGDPSTVDLIPDPALHADELNADGTPKYAKKTFTGPVFTGGAQATDVAQGQIGDCYLPSAFAAMAHTDPEAIQNMIKANGDGTYTVTFKQKDWATRSYTDVQIKVDGDLYVRSNGAPLYGSSASADQGQKTLELWFPLVEKAYAQWKGSFDTIGNGGRSEQVMQDVLGKDGQSMSIYSGNDDQVWAQIKRATDAKHPMSAGTYGESEAERYTNSGVYANHSYSVLGYEEVNGERYVNIRNPWGQSEPAGNGANDGIFKLKLSEFTKLYQNIMWVEA